VRCATAFPALAACACLMSAHAAALNDPGGALGDPGGALPLAGPPRAAIWKKHQVEFHYLGRTSLYSCNGLRERVRAMLLDLGVRPDLRIAVRGCAAYDRDSAGAEQSSRADGLRLAIDFFAAAPADAAALREAAGDLPSGRFERFTITSDAFRNIGIGDCELVREFARQILPALTVRDVRQKIDCVPYRPGSSRFFVQGEVLRAVPRSGAGSA